MGFKGANRIVVAIEIQDGGWDPDNPTKRGVDIIIVRYNKDEDVLKKMLEEYKERVGDNFILKR